MAVEPPRDLGEIPRLVHVRFQGRRQPRSAFSPAREMNQKAAVLRDVLVRIPEGVLEHRPQAFEVVVHHMRQPAVPGVGPLAICPTAVGADVHVLLGDTQDEEAQGAHETHDPRLDLETPVRGVPAAAVYATYDEYVLRPVADHEEDAEGVSPRHRGPVDAPPHRRHARRAPRGHRRRRGLCAAGALRAEPHQAEAAYGPGRNSLRGIDGETETVVMLLGGQALV